MKNLKNLVGLILVASLFASCENSPPVQEKTPVNSNELIINLTSDATENAHGAFMGLHFAEKAQNSGVNVTVFLNVDGVKLLQSGADTISFEEESLRSILDSIQSKGGQVIACPHCMQVHGVKKSDLPGNFILGEEKVMMDKIIGNPTVFTY
ncbi:MAG: DsrE family protein [Cryomorphaceae bacterium]|nr:DsrE family protein [Flavobacteriales bacterium]